MVLKKVVMENRPNGLRDKVVLKILPKDAKEPPDRLLVGKWPPIRSPKLVLAIQF